MGSCVAFGCSNRSCRRKKKSGITFHSFPVNRDLRAAWIMAVRRKNWTPTKYSKLCSDHFSEEVIDRTTRFVRLRENAIPTIFNGFPSYFQKASSIIVIEEMPECDIQTQTTLSSNIIIPELNTSSSKSNTTLSSVLSSLFTASTPLTVTCSKVKIPNPVDALSFSNAVSTNSFAASNSANFVSPTCSDTSSVRSNATATSCSEVRIPDPTVASPYSKVASTKSIDCLPCHKNANSVSASPSLNVFTTNLVADSTSTKVVSPNSIVTSDSTEAVDLNDSKSCSSSSSIWPNTEATCLNVTHSQINKPNIIVDSPSSKVASVKAVVASTCSDVASANSDAKPLPFTISKSACSNVSSSPASTSCEPDHSNIVHYSYLFYKASFKRKEMLYKDEIQNHLKYIKILQQKRRRFKKELNRLFSVAESLRISGALKKELYNAI